MTQIRTYHGSKASGAGVIKASAIVNGKRRTLSTNWDHSLNRDANHRAGVKAFCEKFLTVEQTDPALYNGPAYRGTGIVGDRVCDYWNIA